MLFYQMLNFDATQIYILILIIRIINCLNLKLNKDIKIPHCLLSPESYSSFSILENLMLGAIFWSYFHIIYKQLIKFGHKFIPSISSIRD